MHGNINFYLKTAHAVMELNNKKLNRKWMENNNKTKQKAAKQCSWDFPYCHVFWETTLLELLHNSIFPFIDLLLFQWQGLSLLLNSCHLFVCTINQCRCNGNFAHFIFGQSNWKVFTSTRDAFCCCIIISVQILFQWLYMLHSKLFFFLVFLNSRRCISSYSLLL